LWEAEVLYSVLISAKTPQTVRLTLCDQFSDYFLMRDFISFMILMSRLNYDLYKHEKMFSASAASKHTQEGTHNLLWINLYVKLLCRTSVKLFISNTLQSVIKNKTVDI